MRRHNPRHASGLLGTLRAVLPRLLGIGSALVAAGSLAAEAAEGWREQQVLGPFVCQSEFPLEQCGRLLNDLEQLQRDLIHKLAIPPAGEPIELYLFRDGATYRKFLSREYPKVPYRRALYIKDHGTGRVFAHRNPQFEVDVRHECTHALLHAALPMVPLWLDEGLAEYFELPAERRAGQNPHQEGIRWAIALGTLPKLEDLERKSGLEEMGRSEYRAAWAWVHFLLHGSPQGQRALREFLGDIQAGTPPGLLSRRLGGCFADVPGRFVAHFQERSGWH